MYNKKKLTGFTLIEIAIVLVIISLLIGGILKGQELITNSKIKSIINDAKSISTAIYTYQDRFKAMPGDDDIAQTHLNDATAINGNGDGLLSATEQQNLFAHLRVTGLINGSGNSYPKHSFGGNIIVYSSRGNFNGLTVCFENLDGKYASLVDSSTDDGISNNGSVQDANKKNSYQIGVNYELCWQG
ncbi:MAG: prepilin-type cleavage/methylation domain-containing protein [Gammaproteobacteria bacterium]|nr:MAG: prepilin-type cleavage/methylation domain-containing protein [Gammaproteobacteria bacterium]